MKKTQNDAWIFGAFSAGTELPASLEARLRQDYETIRQSGRREEKTMKRHMKKTVKTTLALAAAVAALTVSALAVYQYTIKDAVIEQAPVVNYNTANHEEEIQHADALSMNGFADSPEYQAFVEWEAFQAQWQVDNPNWFADRGVDDTYYETPDNYLQFYNAYAQEQAQKLDEIIARYGLKLLAERHSFRTERQLCRALGIDDILSDEYKTVGEYIYDNGSFRLDATTNVDGVEYWMTCTSSVRGSFFMIEGGMPTEYEEWSYTTAAGREVIVMTHDDSATVVAGLDGCFVVANLQPWDVPYGTTAAVTRAQAEALADAIDLEAINACFATERARTAVAESVAAFAESRNGANPEEVTDDDGAAIVLDILGSYYLPNPPEGLNVESCHYELPEGPVEDTGYYQISYYYNGIPNGIGLTYRTLEPGETELELADPRELARQGMNQTFCTVGDYQAILEEPNDLEDDLIYRSLTWLDTDRELVFTLSGYRTPEVLTELALSVTAQDPSLETGSAAYAARARQHRAEIDALLDAEQAEYDAYVEQSRAEYESAIARMGDYVITAPGIIPHQPEWDFSNGVMPIENTEVIPAEVIGYWQDVNKSYKDTAGRFVSLRYATSWDAEDETISRNAAAFAHQKEDYIERQDPPMTVTDGLAVNGYEAYLTIEEMHTAGSDYVETLVSLCWYDTDRDLRFTVDTGYSNEPDTPEPLTTDDLIAIAESVSEAK